MHYLHIINKEIRAIYDVINCERNPFICLSDFIHFIPARSLATVHLSSFFYYVVFSLISVAFTFTTAQISSAHWLVIGLNGNRLLLLDTKMSLGNFVC